MTRSSACLVFSGLLAACGGPPPPAVWEGRTMATRYQVRVAGPSLDPAERRALEEGVQAVFDRVDGLLSTFKPESELSRFNRHLSTQPFPVSPELAAAARHALETHRLSGGAFDPTVKPLVELWGFGASGRVPGPPPEAAVRRALEEVGAGRLSVLEGPALRKSRPGLELDLNAVAEGLALDAAGALLLARGRSDFMIELGGEVFARGRSERGEPWRIGIERPEPGSDRQVQRVLRLKDASLATSGSYRNFFTEGERRYSHILDPRTGRPVVHSLVSASVLAPSSLEADAAATAIMAMGPEEGLRWAEETPGWEAYLVLARPEGGFEERSTSGWEALLSLP